MAVAFIVKFFTFGTFFYFLSCKLHIILGEIVLKTISLKKWLPESARYLVAAGRPDLAISSLQRIAQLNERSLPPGRLIEGNKATINGRGKLVDLFSPTLAGTTFRLWILWTVNAFCYYGGLIYYTYVKF